MQQRYDGLQLRILESTLAIVGESGLENLTIRKVATHADVSLGIVHHHFDNKANLIFRTYDHLIRLARAQITSARRTASDPAERLHQTAQLCFIPALMTRGAANVWPQMWSNAVYDDSVQRLCSVFSKRLISNLSWDFNQTGCNHRLARTYAVQTSALIHGLWIEHSILGNISIDDATNILDSNIAAFTGEIWLPR